MYNEQGSLLARQINIETGWYTVKISQTIDMLMLNLFFIYEGH